MKTCTDLRKTVRCIAGGKGQIHSMQLVQTDVEGTVSPGDTIDVAPVIYNDGTFRV